MKIAGVKSNTSHLRDWRRASDWTHTCISLIEKWFPPPTAAERHSCFHLSSDWWICPCRNKPLLTWDAVSVHGGGEYLEMKLPFLTQHLLPICSQHWHNDWMIPSVREGQWVSVTGRRSVPASSEAWLTLPHRHKGSWADLKLACFFLTRGSRCLTEEAKGAPVGVMCDTARFSNQIWSDTK